MNNIYKAVVYTLYADTLITWFVPVRVFPRICPYIGFGVVWIGEFNAGVRACVYVLCSVQDGSYAL